ncbi:hypothetical protein GOBAR_AA09488 [Gossypium barbadense]|uniref:Uncharacterized protein n=1 Tax=Gossypium barbadense TaxID=3634 RepID=A0A2P5Y6F3_GOSBA|nr:hypothetical protein GOBAR_AA09488 [Gossypium barbadense]
MWIVARLSHRGSIRYYVLREDALLRISGDYPTSSDLHPQFRFTVPKCDREKYYTDYDTRAVCAARLEHRGVWGRGVRVCSLVFAVRVPVGWLNRRLECPKFYTPYQIIAGVKSSVALIRVPLIGALAIAVVSAIHVYPGKGRWLSEVSSICSLRPEASNWLRVCYENTPFLSTGFPTLGNSMTPKRPRAPGTLFLICSAWLNPARFGAFPVSETGYRVLHMTSIGSHNYAPSGLEGPDCNRGECFTQDRIKENGGRFYPFSKPGDLFCQARPDLVKDTPFCPGKKTGPLFFNQCSRGPGGWGWPAGPAGWKGGRFGGQPHLPQCKTRGESRRLLLELLVGDNPRARPLGLVGVRQVYLPTGFGGHSAPFFSVSSTDFLTPCRTEEKSRGGSREGVRGRVSQNPPASQKSPGGCAGERAAVSGGLPVEIFNKNALTNPKKGLPRRRGRVEDRWLPKREVSLRGRCLRLSGVVRFPTGRYQPPVAGSPKGGAVAAKNWLPPAGLSRGGERVEGPMTLVPHENSINAEGYQNPAGARRFPKGGRVKGFPLALFPHPHSYHPEAPGAVAVSPGIQPKNGAGGATPPGFPESGVSGAGEAVGPTGGFPAGRSKNPGATNRPAPKKGRAFGRFAVGSQPRGYPPRKLRRAFCRGSVCPPVAWPPSNGLAFHPAPKRGFPRAGSLSGRLPTGLPPSAPGRRAGLNTTPPPGSEARLLVTPNQKRGLPPRARGGARCLVPGGSKNGYPAAGRVRNAISAVSVPGRRFHGLPVEGRALKAGAGSPDPAQTVFTKARPEGACSIPMASHGYPTGLRIGVSGFPAVSKTGLYPPGLPPPRACLGFPLLQPGYPPGGFPEVALEAAPRGCVWAPFICGFCGPGATPPPPALCWSPANGPACVAHHARPGHPRARRHRDPLGTKAKLIKF